MLVSSLSIMPSSHTTGGVAVTHVGFFIPCHAFVTYHGRSGLTVMLVSSLSIMPSSHTTGVGLYSSLASAASAAALAASAAACLASTSSTALSGSVGSAAAAAIASAYALSLADLIGGSSHSRSRSRLSSRSNGIPSGGRQPWQQQSLASLASSSGSVLVLIRHATCSLL